MDQNHEQPNQSGKSDPIESEAAKFFLASIGESLEESIFGVDSNGIITTWNKGAELLSDYSAEEALGKPLMALALPKDLEAMQANVESVRRGERIGSHETKTVRKDGHDVQLSIKISPVKNDAGKIIGVSIIARDITKHQRAENTLRESESRFNVALKVAQLGTFEWNVTTNEVILDERSREIFGFVKGEGTRAQEVFDRIHPSDFELVFAETQKSIQTMSRLETEYRIKLPGGTIRHICSISETTPGEGGKAERMFGVFSDITERKQKEDEISRLGERNRVILESITDAFFAIDGDWRFTYANSQAERMLERQPGDLIGKVIWEEYPGLIESDFEKAYRRAATERVQSTLTAYYPDHERWYEVHVYPAANGITIYFRDVTERISAEESLKSIQAKTERQRRFYDTILSNTPDLVYVFDLDHRFTYANEVLLKMWGKTSDEAIGKTCLELGYEPWHAEMHDREIEQVKATKKPIRGEVPFAGTFGRRIYDYIFVPIFGANGEVEAVAGTTRDVTDRTYSEAALRESEERYRTLFNSIDEGFCVIEMIFDESRNPVDYRFLEINPAFDQQTGLKDARGKRIREFAPNHEEFWFETYGRIALTGEPVRFEHRAEALSRWYDVYAFRVGDQESRKVAVLFNDISARKHSEEELRHQRNFTAAITDSMGEGLYALDAQWRLTFINPAAEKILGWHQSELLGRNMHEAVHFQKADGSPYPPEECPLREVLKSRVVVQNEDDVFTTRDGSLVPVSYTSSPIIIDGEVVGAVLSFRDITERKKAESALRESQEVLSLAMSGSRMGAWSRDLEKNEVYWSPELEAIFGLEPGTFSGDIEGFYKYVYREDAERIKREVWEAIDERRSYVVEFRYRHAGGGGEELRWMEGRGQAVYAPTGEPTKVYGIGVDITERKRAELNAKFLAEISQDMVRVSTPHEIVRIIGERLNRFLNISICAFAEVSETAEQVTINYEWHQTDVTDLRGVYRLSDFITDEFRRAAFAGRTIIIRDVKDDERIADPQKYEQLMIGAEINVPLIRDGRWKFSLVIFHQTAYNWRSDEITLMQELASRAWTRLERAFAEEEREELLKREHAARLQAEEANRLKDEFLATVSHELRTPLNAILGWSQMLTTSKLDADVAARAMETIYRNAKSQAQLVEDILDVSRIITGKLRIDAKPVPISPIIQTVVESLRPSVEAKNIRLRMHFDFESGTVHADPDRLQQVVWNLLSNAIKFTPERGQITIEIESDEGETKIIVSDTGQGIRAEFLPYVFDRFRQADGSTTRQQGGLGLGLAIVRHIVELHGGTVAVSSKGEGQGTTFMVRLPLSKPSSADHSEPTGGNVSEKQHSGFDEVEVEADESKIKGLRILLVDDEKDTLELQATVLIQHGAEVKTLPGVDGAVEIIKQWKPHVVVSDIAMPGEDGFSFIKKLRALPPEEGGTTPAMALTAYVGKKEQAQILSSGFQMYVPKPVEPTTLLQALASLL